MKQITKIPENLETKKDKKKDPKKVAAGRALAKKNKEARSVFENQNLNQKQEEEFSFLDLSNKFIYISSLVGAGFTFYQMYQFFYPNKKTVTFEEETNEIEEEPKKNNRVLIWIRSLKDENVFKNE